MLNAAAGGGASVLKCRPAPPRPPGPHAALCQLPRTRPGEPVCEAGGEVQTFLGVYLRRRRLVGPSKTHNAPKAGLDPPWRESWNLRAPGAAGAGEGLPVLLNLAFFR
jgi:hypothetical protein